VGKGLVEKLLFISSLKQSMIGTHARGKTPSTRRSRCKALRGWPMDKNLSGRRINIHSNSTIDIRLQSHIEIRLKDGRVFIAGGEGVNSIKVKLGLIML
jgi:hypothetical protein